MPIYNLLQCSDNSSMTSGNLWNYYRDKIKYDANENDDAENKIYNDKVIASKSFEYKIKVIGRTPDNSNTLDIEVVAPWKY